MKEINFRIFFGGGDGLVDIRIGSRGKEVGKYFSRE